MFIIFVVSGFWHGANWTFIVWGALNALYFIPLLLAKKNRLHTGTVAPGRLWPSFKEVGQMGFTFLLTLMAWVFFRSETLGQAVAYLSGICSPRLFSMPEVFPLKTVALILVFVLAEWVQRDKQHALELSEQRHPAFLRWGLYYGTAALVILFAGAQQEFIYFQF